MFAKVKHPSSGSSGLRSHKEKKFRMFKGTCHDTHLYGKQATWRGVQEDLPTALQGCEAYLQYIIILFPEVAKQLN